MCIAFLNFNRDLNRNLPPSFSTLPPFFGVVVRTSHAQFELDMTLKLVVANATHTACAHALALSSFLDTAALQRTEVGRNVVMSYIDSFFEEQILPTHEANKEEAWKVYKEWRARLVHEYFGLSTFFIGQNGVMKSGIRLSPTVRKLIQLGKVSDDIMGNL